MTEIPAGIPSGLGWTRDPNVDTYAHTESKWHILAKEGTECGRWKAEALPYYSDAAVRGSNRGLCATCVSRYLRSQAETR